MPVPTQWRLGKAVPRVDAHRAPSKSTWHRLPRADNPADAIDGRRYSVPVLALTGRCPYPFGLATPIELGASPPGVGMQVTQQSMDTSAPLQPDSPILGPPFSRPQYLRIDSNDSIRSRPIKTISSFALVQSRRFHPPQNLTRLP